MSDQDNKRPSISSLQQYNWERQVVRHAIGDLRRAAPVLLEIAAAALRLRGPCDHPDGRCSNGSHYRGCSRFAGEKELEAALAKVRP